MGKQFKLSVVSPVYRAEKIVDELVRRISDELDKIDHDFEYEIVLVDDGSPDGAWKKIEENCRKHPFVKGVKLSRNFGQHAATEAGLANADGDYIVLIDCDLQEDPVYIGQMLEKCLNGAEIVLARKAERKHSFVKNLYAFIFRMLFSFLTSKKDHIIYDSRVGTFSMITKKIRDTYMSVGDLYKPFTGIIGWIGFEKEYIDIEHRERFEGKSSYTLMKSLMHALNGIIGFSDKPLYMSIYTGLIFVFISCAYGIYLIIAALFFNIGPSGWPSLIVAVIFSGGMILINLGICSLYIAKVFEQSKNRPRYVIDRKVN